MTHPHRRNQNYSAPDGNYGEPGSNQAPFDGLSGHPTHRQQEQRQMDPEQQYQQVPEYQHNQWRLSDNANGVPATSGTGNNTPDSNRGGNRGGNRARGRRSRPPSGRALHDPDAGLHGVQSQDARVSRPARRVETPRTSLTHEQLNRGLETANANWSRSLEDTPWGTRGSSTPLSEPRRASANAADGPRTSTTNLTNLPLRSQPATAARRVPSLAGSATGSETRRPAPATAPLPPPVAPHPAPPVAASPQPDLTQLLQGVAGQITQVVKQSMDKAEKRAADDKAELFGQLGSFHTQTTAKIEQVESASVARDNVLLNRDEQLGAELRSTQYGVKAVAEAQNATARNVDALKIDMNTFQTGMISQLGEEWNRKQLRDDNRLRISEEEAQHRNAETQQQLRLMDAAQSQDRAAVKSLGERSNERDMQVEKQLDKLTRSDELNSSRMILMARELMQNRAQIGDLQQQLQESERRQITTGPTYSSDPGLNLSEYPERRLLMGLENQTPVTTSAFLALPAPPSAGEDQPMAGTMSPEQHREAYESRVKLERKIWEDIAAKLERSFLAGLPLWTGQVMQALASQDRQKDPTCDMNDYVFARQTVEKLCTENGLAQFAQTRIHRVGSAYNAVWDETETLLNLDSTPLSNWEFPGCEVYMDDLMEIRSKAQPVLRHEYATARGEIVRHFKTAYLRLFRFTLNRWIPKVQEDHLTSWKSAHDQLLAMLELNEGGLEEQHHLPTTEEALLG